MTKVAHLPHRSVRYLEAGSGEPTVLLHAFPLSAEQWLPQLNRPPAGRRLIAPDLRGFRGLGAAFEDSPLSLASLTMADYAGDVFALMDHLDVRSATVAGVSMGGYVAFEMLRQAPARVTGLVLSNTRATADSAAAREARDRAIALVLRDGPPAIAREMVPKLLGATTRREQPDLVEVVTRLIEANSTEAIAAALRAIRDRPDSTPLLSRIACPTTIVHGEEDVIIAREESELMHRGIPGSRLVVLPRVGHLANVEGTGLFSTVWGKTETGLG